MKASCHLETVRKVLLRRGAPGAYIERLIKELAEHREDLVRDLVLEGMEGDAAEGEADRRLGDPVELAESAFTKMRRSSVVGRHRVFWLIVLPALLVPVSWIVLVGLAAWNAGILSSKYRIGTITAWTDAWPLAWMYIACEMCAYVAPATIGAALYLLARRKFCGRVWAWMPVLSAWAISSLLFVEIFPGRFWSPIGRVIMGVARHFDPMKLVFSVGVLILLEGMQMWLGDFSLWNWRRWLGFERVKLAEGK